MAVQEAPSVAKLMFGGLLLALGIAGLSGVCFRWERMQQRFGGWLRWKTFFGNQFPMSRIGVFSMFFFLSNFGASALLQRVPGYRRSDWADYHLLVIVFALVFFFGMWVKDYLHHLDHKDD